MKILSLHVDTRIVILYIILHMNKKVELGIKPSFAINRDECLVIRVLRQFLDYR